MTSEKRAARGGAAVTALDFHVRSNATARGDACCSPSNKHTEEDQLTDDIQEDEREADDDE